MRKLVIVVACCLLVLSSSLAMAEDTAIQELQTDVSVTKGKADANAAAIESLKGGLPAEQAARIAADDALWAGVGGNNDAISTLKSLLIEEREARIAADADLAARLAVVEVFESRIAALESELADAFDLIATLQNSVLDLDPNGELGQLANHVSVVDSPLNELPGPHVVFDGVNVHVRNGSGYTGSPSIGEYPNGLGNLIIGYNEIGSQGNILYREGASHILVIGPGHAYGISNQGHPEYTDGGGTYGGMVVGKDNYIKGPMTTVAGGINSFAWTPYSWAAGPMSYDYNFGSFDLETTGGMNITSDGRMFIHSQNILNLDGSLIKLNGGTRPVSGLNDTVAVGVEYQLAPIVTGSPTVFIP